MMNKYFVVSVPKKKTAILVKCNNSTIESCYHNDTECPHKKPHYLNETCLIPFCSNMGVEVECTENFVLLCKRILKEGKLKRGKHGKE